VKVTMTCKHDVKRVHRPSLLADDKDMLEDLVAAAFNDGVRRAEEVSQEKMGKLTAGMPLPPGMKLAVLSRAAVRTSLEASSRPAPPARRRRQVGAAHGLPPAAARPRRRADARGGADGAVARIVTCARCHTFTEATVCSICLDPSRDCASSASSRRRPTRRARAHRQLPRPVLRADGRHQPARRRGPSEIGARELLERAGDGRVEEVIIATNFTAEGEATRTSSRSARVARHPRDRLAPRRSGRQRARVRRLGTIAHAFIDRR
jgi:hypothetical protein